ncbi:MAG: YnbE family lipoprotein [Sphingomonas sp. SCN 67-18]|uniref:YnbE family lipoprotein n=1 Tax=uncultured Sphingomonas sp. TaxID=158754 RepID=UPI00086EAE8E|nr:YnbE family lipoprotein [Sphingomonas sp. SCN 67-18]ODU19756.1 MAG: YnbE family lipoprotein [Sphingomonas sp. SCN 67-18]
MRCLILIPLAGLSAALAGCIQVKAPDKPIEINLNVNVKQEVLVRLQRDAEEIIQDNPELFPK